MARQIDQHIDHAVGEQHEPTPRPERPPEPSHDAVELLVQHLAGGLGIARAECLGDHAGDQMELRQVQRPITRPQQRFGGPALGRVA